MLVNGRFISRSLTGVDRFAVETLGAAVVNFGQKLDFVLPRDCSSTLPRSLVESSKVLFHGSGQGHLWEQTQLTSFRPDELLLNLCNTAPVLREHQLVVIHDAITRAQPSNYSIAFRAWYRFLHSCLTVRARGIATVSHFSASEISRFFNIPASRIEIISESGEHILNVGPDNTVFERLGLEGKPYVFAVGSNSPNKNFSAVVDALSLLGTDECTLVVAGGSNLRVFSQTDVVSKNYVRAGYVSDAELRALYENALCFVFPSFYEGFGLPPLEAMTCGCPVIVSDRASLPEVCGDAALYCNPWDPSSITKLIRQLLDSRALTEELAEAGRSRASKFAWRDAASSLLDISKRCGS